MITDNRGKIPNYIIEYRGNKVTGAYVVYHQYTKHKEVIGRFKTLTNIRNAMNRQYVYHGKS